MLDAASFELAAQIKLEEIELTELCAVSTPAVLPDLKAENVSREVMIEVPPLPLPAIRPLLTIVVHTVNHMFFVINSIDGDQVPLFRVALISVVSRFKRVTLKDNRFALDFDLDRDLTSSLEVGLGCPELIFGFL